MPTRHVLLAALLLAVQSVKAENAPNIEITQPGDPYILVEKAYTEDIGDSVILRGTVIDKKSRIYPQGHFDIVISAADGSTVAERQVDYYPKQSTGGTPHHRESTVIHRTNIFRIALPKNLLEKNIIKISFHAPGTAKTHAAPRTSP